MDGIVFDGRRNIAACLLEAEAHPAGTREKIDTDGSSGQGTFGRNAILANSQSLPQIFASDSILNLCC
jgi:hypothetical protein